MLLFLIVFLFSLHFSSSSPFSSPSSLAPAPRLVSACYGLFGCVGVPSATNLTDLRARGCVVVTDPNNSTTGNMLTNSPTLQAINAQCGAKVGDTQLMYTDGMPITFNYRLDSTAKINPNAIQITLTNGQIVFPKCVSLAPANEDNEGYTLLLIGHFGSGLGPSSSSSSSSSSSVFSSASSNSDSDSDSDSDSADIVQPLRIDVVDDLMAVNGTGFQVMDDDGDSDSNSKSDAMEERKFYYYYESEGTNNINLKGLSLDLTNSSDVTYKSASIHIVAALLSRFSLTGEAGPLLRLLNKAYPNHCEALYGVGSTTHRLVVITNGGGTLDGVTTFNPSMLTSASSSSSSSSSSSLSSSSSDVFMVTMKNGTTLNARSGYVGIADIGQKTGSLSRVSVHDRDNFFDICLSLTDEDAAQVHRVTMPCEPGTAGAIVPPKGFPVCSKNSKQVTIV